MHKVEYYQLPKSGRWRWKLLYNDQVLARGEGSYSKRSHAKRAFRGVWKSLAKLKGIRHE